MNQEVSKRPEKIREMFDEISDNYDKLNRILSGYQDIRWRRKLVREVRGNDVLDLACGSGDVMELLGEFEDFTNIIGADFSRRMLLKASNRTQESTGEVPSYVQGDALKLPLKNNSFDSITCAFGVRNFVDRSTAYEEIHRILRSGGRFITLEFFAPEYHWWNFPVTFYLNWILPFLGSLISSSPQAYEYLSRSIDSFIQLENYLNELKSAGFNQTQTFNVSFGLVYLVVATRS